MTQLNVNIRKVHPAAVTPQYATDGAAAFDLCALQGGIIEPGATAKIPLGLAFEIPPGHALLIAIRSGIALKTSLRQPNAPAIIDSDYRGDVAVLFDNTNEDTDEWGRSLLTLDGNETDWDVGRSYPAGSYLIQAGERIAQGFVIPMPRVEFTEVAALSETARGAGGFGSTGISTEMDFKISD